MSPRKTARRALPIVDVYARQILAGAAARASCAKCTHAHCCRIVPVAVLGEAVALVDAFARGGGDLKSLRAQAAADAAFLRDAEDPSYDYMLSGRQCALLDARTNRCRAYAARPITCRVYFVVSPPAECAPDARRVVSALDTRAHALALFETFANATSSAIPSWVAGTLPEMILAAFAFLELDAASFLAWARVERDAWDRVMARIEAHEGDRMAHIAQQDERA